MSPPYASAAVSFRFYSILRHPLEASCRWAQANEVLFVDTEHDNEVLTFRELFLSSRALELLVAGCVRARIQCRRPLKRLGKGC